MTGTNFNPSDNNNPIKRASSGGQNKNQGTPQEPEQDEPATTPTQTTGNFSANEVLDLANPNAPLMAAQIQKNAGITARIGQQTARFAALHSQALGIIQRDGLPLSGEAADFLATQVAQKLESKRHNG